MLVGADKHHNGWTQHTQSSDVTGCPSFFLFSFSTYLVQGHFGLISLHLPRLTANSQMAAEIAGSDESTTSKS